MTPIRVPTHRAPTHPGEMLLEEFLKPMKIPQTRFAEAIGVSFQMVNGIVRGHRSVTTEMALRFARYFGSTPDFWINLQLRCDLYEAQKKLRKELAKIEPVGAV
jgi:addiction module HigA family antidote